MVDDRGGQVALECDNCGSQIFGKVQVSRRGNKLAAIWHFKVLCSPYLAQDDFRRYVNGERRSNWLHLVFGLECSFTYVMLQLKQLLYHREVAIFPREPCWAEDF